MLDKIISLIDKLQTTGSLTVREYQFLIDNRTPQGIEFVRERAVTVRKRHYGNEVFIRGLIEISNICKHDCLYCGIRCGNGDCERYRLSEDDIFSCCDDGYALGFRTFVMQGGEDAYFSDERICALLREIKSRYPDCAVTLSLGERSKKSYQNLFDAGADRYLLRHETADAEHYAMLHPQNMSWCERMECLKNLKEIGFQTGCGFMVGSPYQTSVHLAKDLKFIEEFKPHMCGIGPFIPHKATVFSEHSAGSVELTCYLLSLIRLIRPTILLPATTALGSLEEYGREKGIMAGANVVMPNLSPMEARGKYELYNNKLFTKAESAQALDELSKRIENIGYKIVCARGDAK